MFTLSNTMKEIYEDPFVGKHTAVVGMEAFWYMVPEQKRGLTLAELERTMKMPWGGPFNGKEIASMANFLERLKLNQGMHFQPLWEEKAADGELYMPASDNSKDAAALLVFDVEGEETRKPVLICPGGAYMFVSIADEGGNTAEAMLAKGYRPFVLKYRCTPANPHPTPQLELTLAIKYLRANAEAFHIDPDDLMIIGYSAGGHLCGSQSAYAEEYGELLNQRLKEENPALYEKLKDMSPKADQVVLGYPATYLEAERDKDFRSTITGGDEALTEKLSFCRHVTPAYPKTYIWCCEDDPTVPIAHSACMAKALEEQKVSHKLHIFPSGGHGINTAKGTSAEGWVDEMLDFFTE